MAEKKFDIKAWIKEVNNDFRILKNYLKKDQKSADIVNRVQGIQGLFNSKARDIDTGDITQLAEIAAATTGPNSPVNMMGISADDLIKISKFFMRGQKPTTPITNKNIQTIINNITTNVTTNITTVINNNCRSFCDELLPKLNEIIDLITKLGKGNEKILSQLKLINNKINKITVVMNQILEQLRNIEAVLQKIQANTEEMQKDVAELLKEVRDLKGSLIDSQVRIEAAIKANGEKLDKILGKLDEMNQILADIYNLLKNLTPETLGNLLGKIDELIRKVSSLDENVSGIKNLIITELIPLIEKIYHRVDDVARDLSELKDTVRQIIDKLDQLSTITSRLLTQEEFVKWMKDIMDALREIRLALGTRGPGPVEPGADVYNKKFELIWILVKNEKVANEIKKEEVLSKEKEYVLINPSHITVNLNEPDQQDIAADHLKKVASELLSKGFDLDKIYICLGARVVGTEKPVRWDIKHLKTSAPDVYNKLKSIIGDKKSDAESIAEIEKSLEKWKKSLKKSPNLSLQFGGKERISDVKKILENLEKLFKRHNDKFGTTQLFQEIINMVMVTIEAWESSTPARILEVHAEDTHIGLIDKISQLMERYIKPALRR